MKQVIFAITDQELKEGKDKLATVFELQLPSFSNLETLGHLLPLSRR